MRQQKARLALWTTRDLGRARYPDQFLDLLGRTAPSWLPERFGRLDPLRGRMSRDGRDGFRRDWLMSERVDASMNSLVWEAKRPSQVGGLVEWRHFPFATFNRVTISIPTPAAEAAWEQVLHVMAELADLIDAEYGRIATDAEFAAGQVGIPILLLGRRPDGPTPTSLPGVYGVNLFGRVLTSYLGRDLLATCPGLESRPLGDGRWLLVISRPEAALSAQAREWKAAAREILPAGLVFDPFDTSPPQHHPAYDFSETLVPSEATPDPAAPVLHRHPAQTPELAGELVERAPVLALSLRQRFPAVTEAFAPADLRTLDAFVIERDRRGREAETQLIIPVAAYYGEVVRRLSGGRWEVTGADGADAAIRIPDGRVEYPVVRAIKLCEDGDRLLDSLDWHLRGL